MPLLQRIQTTLQSSSLPLFFSCLSLCCFANRGFQLLFSSPFHLPQIFWFFFFFFLVCFPVSLHFCPQRTRTALPWHDNKTSSAGSQIHRWEKPLSIPIPWAADIPGFLSVTKVTKEFLGFLSTLNVGSSLLKQNLEHLNMGIRLLKQNFRAPKYGILIAQAKV